jgi:hypothetical protein
MRNLLFDPFDYKVDVTRFGMWRQYRHPDGNYFAEFKSHAQILGFPLIHHTRGKSPETGGRVVAIGVIAVGRYAVGIVGIGQVSLGVVAVGQLGLGFLLGLGQATTGIIAIGQVAIAALFGFGQMATGFVAIGQFGLGHYVLAQLGFGSHVWDMTRSSPAARDFFTSIANWL